MQQMIILAIYIIIIIDLFQMQEKQQTINEKQLKQWRQSLLQLIDTNLALRSSHPTSPMRFYPSQEAIHNILASMQQLTVDHIPILISSQIIQPLIQLLSHPNQDINIGCIQLLHDLLSEQPEQDRIFQMYYRLCVWLIQNGLYQCLADIISKLDEQNNVQQYQIGLKILKLYEVLLQQQQSSIQLLVKETKIIEYLANRILPNYKVTHKVIDDNKFVSSDILALLLSHSLQAQQQFHKNCGMQILLQSLAPFAGKVPASSDQSQFLANLLSCLNILLINNTQQLLKSHQIYHEMKGNKIMIQFLKDKSQYSASALKAIANSTVSMDSQLQNRVAQQLIQYGLLKYIFSVLLRQGVKGKDVDEQMDIDQNCLRIIYLLVRITQPVLKMRVQAKLSQKHYVKLEKMFQLRNQYQQNIGRDAQKQPTSQQYLQRLKEGLAIIQVIDKILASLCSCQSTVKSRMIDLMKLYGVNPQNIEFSLVTCYKYIGVEHEKRKIQKILAEDIPNINKIWQMSKKQ